MPPGVRSCAEHGYFEGSSCPVCRRSGRPVLSGDRRRRLSKFLSGALRHFPGDAGLDLDDGGWTPLPAAVEAVERQYDWADRDAIVAVVATDPKGRFERDASDPGATGTDGSGASDDRIRAAYGHSVDVDLDAGGTPVPDTLYHGTAPRNVAAIEREGLRPMSRQQVHLSGTVDGAREVGRRHADDPAVLVVDAAGLLADGHDVTERGAGVYTTDRVPPAYLTRFAD